MKRVGITGILLFLVLAVTTGCRGEHAEFCTKVSESMCRHCATCGPDGYKACGLLEATDDAACRQTLYDICEAYEPIYSRDLARACLSAIPDAPCSNPKPEACMRMF